MAPRRSKQPLVSRELLNLLDGAPPELIQALSTDPRALEEGELLRALACLYCVNVERGESPSLPLQEHFASVLRDALSKADPDWVVGRTSATGRRDFLLWAEAQPMLAKPLRKGTAVRTAIELWKKKHAHSHSPAISKQVVKRAVARFAWLSALPPDHAKYINRRLAAPPASDSPALHLEGRCLVRVPTACIVEVPRDGGAPQDREHAGALCRSFCIAVEHYGGVALPELLPYFARALRAAMAGKSLKRVLGLDRDRPGRPSRRGALKGWPTNSRQDRRDMWLADEVRRLCDSLPQRNGKPRVSLACRQAAEQWRKLHPGSPVQKDTAQTAWERWGSYVNAIAAVRRQNAARAQVHQEIADCLATLTPLHTRLWSQLVLHASEDGKLMEPRLAIIETEMASFTDFNLDTMLTTLHEAGLLKRSRRGGKRKTEILDIESCKSALGMSSLPPASGSGDYHDVPADPRYPIYAPRSGAESTTGA